MRINIWIPNDTLDRLDSYLKIEYIKSRSSFITQSIEERINAKGVYVSEASKQVSPPQTTKVEVDVKVCKHGSMIGLCKKGCK